MNTQDRAEATGRQYRSRVWAEDRGTGRALLTWQRADAGGESPDDASDARAVAATVGIKDGVSAATVTDGGVLVEYDPATISRAQLAGAVRSALSLDADLKTRGNELMKRVPAYLNLAKTLALDERVSPVPEAARQATALRGPSMRTAGALPIAGRFIPGFPLITRLHTLVPMLRALGSWSREASPEVVNEHLAQANLSRELLDQDLATSQEAVAYARDYAAEAAGKAISAASTVASQMRERSREWARQYAERGDSKEPEP